MAKMVLKAAFVSLSGTDLSSYCKKIELKCEVDEQEVTTWASAGWKELLGGLASGELSLDFLQDFAAGALDSILWPLFGTVVTFEVRPSNAAASASNPKFTGSVLVKEYSPLSGSPGDVAETGLSMPTSGAVSRATS